LQLQAIPSIKEAELLQAEQVEMDSTPMPMQTLLYPTEE